MLKILPLEKPDAMHIMAWNDNRSSDFLYQWAGRGYTYPLSEKQIIDRIDLGAISNHRLYKILLEEDMIGTFELMNIDPHTKSAKVGRYLINPRLAGKGYGTKALEALVSVAFNDLHLKRVWLSVFEFNQPAIRCYEKVGFKMVGKEPRPNGWIAINMEMYNSDFRIQQEV